jgi:hypothetical protein
MADRNASTLVPRLMLLAAVALACDGTVVVDDSNEAVTVSGLVLTGTATASSVEGTGLEAAKAVDGNAGTRWSSKFSDPQWITVDLGSARGFDRVTFTWQNSYAKDYQVRVSNDNATWTTLRTVTNGDGGTDDLTGLSANARYVQMYGTRRATAYGYSMFEFQISSTGGTTGAGGATGAAGTTGSAGAASKYAPVGASASSIQGTGLEAHKAIDGSTGTRWSSQASDPQWLTVDLGAAKPVTRVVLNWEAAFARDYQVRVSNDNATWTTLRAVMNGDGGTDDLAGLSGTGRYVQVYGTRRATVYGYSLWEVQVWGPGSTGGMGAAGTAGGAGTTGTAGTGAAGSTSGALCKRGDAYGYHSTADLTALSSPGSGIRWWYNWAKTPDSGVAGSYQGLGVEFVPMIWGANFISGAASQIPQGAKYLLTFNEPNFFSQANLTPAQAAALWPQIEQIASQRGLKIVSPALNYCGGGCNETDPFVWFDKFFAACPNCRVDYLAVHWYACSLSALKNYINGMKKYGKPIWLTEWSCLDSPGDAQGEIAYMNAAVPYLESEPAVFRYAWFTGRFNSSPRVNLLDAGPGALSAVGQNYVGLAPACR